MGLNVAVNFGIGYHSSNRKQSVRVVGMNDARAACVHKTGRAYGLPKQDFVFFLISSDYIRECFYH